MLGNVACPNQLIDQSKDEYDYSRYRKFVLHNLKKLRFLDSYEITSYEKDLIEKESLFYDVVKMTDSPNADNRKNKKVKSKENWTPLPTDKSSAAPVDNKGG